jgi:hypothetical protein
MRRRIFCGRFGQLREVAGDQTNPDTAWKSRLLGGSPSKMPDVVERMLSWFGNFRRLKLCYE